MHKASDKCWKTKPANDPAPLFCLTAKLCIEVPHEQKHTYCQGGFKLMLWKASFASGVARPVGAYNCERQDGCTESGSDHALTHSMAMDRATGERAISTMPSSASWHSRVVDSMCTQLLLCRAT